MLSATSFICRTLDDISRLKTGGEKIPIIGRNAYHNAMEKILDTAGYTYQKMKLGKILIYKNGRKIYIDIAGKNLPYLFGSNRKAEFPWETHIRPNRLDKIEIEAGKYLAESWIVFCYAILKEEYKQHFSTIIRLNGIDFGAKFIKTNSYQKHRKRRSPSWERVDLPREKVLQITCNVEEI